MGKNDINPRVQDRNKSADDRRRSNTRRAILKKVGKIGSVGTILAYGTTNVNAEPSVEPLVDDSRIIVNGQNGGGDYRIVVHDSNGTYGTGYEPNDDNVNRGYGSNGNCTVFSGGVRNGKDSYWYDGAVLKTTVHGDMIVNPDYSFDTPTSNGEITVKGHGEYRFEMTGLVGINPDYYESNDSSGDDWAEGHVAGGTDKYYVDGNIKFMRFWNVGNHLTIEHECDLCGTC
ncbi:hypothetical protein V5735_19530 [Haladaptatus sp. SPP-AMP-3]|uniref:hypothetical protein n=1 Tax=Haladaptatus sp. SPP-AMP-3 TaxID=3121295 RepID=UPI003C2FD686